MMCVDMCADTRADMRADMWVGMCCRPEHEGPARIVMACTVMARPDLVSVVPSMKEGPVVEMCVEICDGMCDSMYDDVCVETCWHVC